MPASTPTQRSAPMTNTYWNAEVYDRIGKPMRRWAQQVIDDLELRGDETVLDAGCGSGSVTFDLLEKLPRGKIYAVDASAEMIASLRSRSPSAARRDVVPMRRQPDRLHAAGAGRRRVLERRVPLDPGRRRALRIACSARRSPAAACARSAAASATTRTCWRRSPRCGRTRASRSISATSATPRSTARRRKRRPRSSARAGATVRASLFEAAGAVR